MIEIISAGGVVFNEDSVLMLKKKNGDWVLPKGRIEINESLEATALREVKEETNIDAVILDYIGATSYEFSNYWTQYKLVNKTVSWYIMQAVSFDLIPLENEGFVRAEFVPFDKASHFARYDDERNVIENALKLIAENNYS